MITAWMAGTSRPSGNDHGLNQGRLGMGMTTVRNIKWLSSLTRPMPAMAWGEGRRGQQAMFPNPHALEMQGRSNYASDVNQSAGKRRREFTSLEFFNVDTCIQCIKHLRAASEPNQLGGLGISNFSLRLDLARQRPAPVPKKVIRETPQGWLGICNALGY